jgi:hypothetical protein
MQPDLAGINAFLNTHDLAALGQFTGNHTFQVNQSSGQIWLDFQEFQKSIRVLSMNATNAEAMKNVVAFMESYKEHYMNQSLVVGASGAVFGILLAFGMMFPNAIIYIYFAFPLKAKYFVIIYGVFELIEGVWNRPGNNIAHFAHLGGMLFGYFLILYWRKKGDLY